MYLGRRAHMSYWYTGCGRGRSEKSGISEMMKTGEREVFGACM